MYVNELLYNFWGPFLVEETDKLSWAEKSKEDNQPKVNFDKNRIYFEEWLQEQMLSIYNGATANARYDSRIQLIQDKLCLLFDDYLHRMSMLTNRDYESFKVSADNWVKSTKWSIETLLTEYESMKDLPISMKTGDAGKKTREVRMAVNREVSSILIRVLSDMQQGSLSSLQYYRRMRPAPFYSEEDNLHFSTSHNKKKVAFSVSHENLAEKIVSKTFKPCDAELDTAKLMSYFHSHMDGKSDVAAFKYIHVAVMEGYIDRPEINAVKEEFKVKGDKTTYNDYVGFSGKFNSIKKHQGALDAIRKELHLLLDEKSE